MRKCGLPFPPVMNNRQPARRGVIGIGFYNNTTHQGGVIFLLYTHRKAVKKHAGVFAAEDSSGFCCFSKKESVANVYIAFRRKAAFVFSEFLYSRLSDIIFVIIGQSFPCFPMFSMLMKSFTPKSMRKLHNIDHLKLVKSQILFRMYILLLHSLTRHAIFSIDLMKSFPFL